MNKWKTVNRISKHKIKRIKGSKSITLTNYTKGIKWTNTKCVYSLMNLTTKNNISDFSCFANKINDNEYELASYGRKISEYDDSQHPHKLYIYEDTWSTQPYFINKNIKNGFFYIDGFTWENFDGERIWGGVDKIKFYALGFTIYINGEVLIDTNLEYIEGDRGWKGYRLKKRVGNPSCFSQILSSFPFVATVKQDFINSLKVNIKVKTEPTSNRNWLIDRPYDPTGYFYIRGINCWLKVFTDEGVYPIDNDGLALFYEQGGE